MIRSPNNHIIKKIGSKLSKNFIELIFFIAGERIFFVTSSENY